MDFEGEEKKVLINPKQYDIEDVEDEIKALKKVKEIIKARKSKNFLKRKKD